MYFIFLRWVNLRAIKRLIDTDELKIENFSSLKVAFLYLTKSFSFIKEANNS